MQSSFNKLISINSNSVFMYDEVKSYFPTKTIVGMLAGLVFLNSFKAFRIRDWFFLRKTPAGLINLNLLIFVIFSKYSFPIASGKFCLIFASAVSFSIAG